MHSVSERTRMLGVYEPAFWVVSCCSRHIRITTRTQQTLMLLIISELTQNRYGFLNVSTNYTYKFLIHILFWFVLLITTSQSAGVLHVPACNHDRPPKAGTYFLCTCAVYHITYITGCTYRHTRSRLVVGVGDLLYQHNEGKQISENQYFHVDTSLFLTYYIQKTGCESGIYILITGV